MFDTLSPPTTAGNRPARTAMRAAAALAVAVFLGVLMPALPAHASVQCGDVIVASTTLTQDLTNCFGSGIRIGASNVGLDLNGHTISGEGIGSGVVIEPSRTNVTVRKGTIRGFERGVDVKQSVTNSTVSGLKLTGNITGFWNDATASGLTVSNSRISNNQGLGIAVFGNSHRVQGNAVHDNGQAGIFVNGATEPGAGTVVTGNQAYRNGHDGIALLEGVHAIVSFNQVSQNGNDGIEVGGTLSTAQVQSNSVNANTERGIVVHHPGSALKANSANLNASIGISAAPGVIDGGGNQAAGNGGTNCLGLVCS